MKPAFLLFYLIFPLMAFSFSETELESLETEGTKTFSKSSWRRDFGFSLIRNLKVETRHKHFSEEEEGQKEKSNKKSRLCQFNKKGSLCDLSSLNYKLDFTLYYSLGSWAEEYLNYSFLKNTEFFLGNSFISAFKSGGCLNRKGYNNFKGYVQCGIGDLLAGWTTPVYQKDRFFSYFNFSMIVWPLSQESRDGTLKTALEGSLSALYFVQKQDKWSGSLSSSHSLAYNHFSDPVARRAKLAYNNPFDTTQQLSLIFKQSFNPYLPANTTLFVSYNLAMDTYKTHWMRLYIEERETPLKRIVLPKYKKDLKKCLSQAKLGSVIACGNRWQSLALGLSSS
ncbi:MAG: hypothetical protein OXJ52_08820, partial [Oligoflexia bacterium]|nr:hypothetical protein [Oligoflexia bacterium]